MTLALIDRCTRGAAAKLALATLALLVAGCSAAPPGEPVAPPSDVLDLYAATYGTLPGTGEVATPAPNAPSEPTPDEAALGTPDAASSSDAEVPPPPPADEIAVLAPVDEIAALAPVDEIAALAPVDEIAALAPVDEIAALAPVDEIAALAPADEIAARAPADEIAAPAPEPPEIDAAPSDLFGLDEARITALLGPPHYRRNEPPARVLQYAGRACVLDLFLYPEGPDGAMATVYFEMRPTGEAPVPSGCFSGLVLAARGY